MADLVWTEDAVSDLRKIVQFVRQRSPERARALAAQLTQAPEHLRHSPRMGRVIPEYGQESFRELVSVHPYRIIYVLRDDTCHIAHIIHGSRNLTDWLRPEHLDDIV
jgi:toxin ParE1/3/4